MLSGMSGGHVDSKTLHILQLSISEFFRRNRAVWFLTFSEPPHDGPGERLWTKDEAEEHFKPFRDRCRRDGIELLVVWELQKRGAWHPHCLVNRRFNVDEMRPWMMERGWGQQMRFEWVDNRVVIIGPDGHTMMKEGESKVVSYLTKRLQWYLTKSVASAETDKKKVFGGSHVVKAGTTRFKWAPWEKPGAYLWAMGVMLFSQLYGEPPRFRDMGHVMRLGVEESGWAQIDPWWEFSVPSS
jgi:hypothetical protein